MLTAVENDHLQQYTDRQRHCQHIRTHIHIMPLHITLLIHLSVSYLCLSDSSLDGILDRGEAYSREGRDREALYEYLSALRVDPTNAFAMQGAASSLVSLGQFIEAGEYFEQMALLSSMSEHRPHLLLNAGMAYHRGGGIHRAADVYTSCVSGAPAYKPCHIKLAELYNRRGAYDMVQKHMQIALAIDPTDFECYIHLGDVYNNLKQFQLAIRTYEAALPYARSSTEAGQVYFAIGDAYSNMKQHSVAKEYYTSALRKISAERAPAEMLIGLLFNMMQTGHWQRYEALSKAVVVSTVSSLSRPGIPSPLSPYRALFLPVDPAFALAISRSWAREYRREGEGVSIQDSDTCRGSSSVSADRVLRVGYISRRFEDYPGTQMMLRIFSHHNRSRVWVSTYAHGPDDGSPHRAFIRKHADKFADVSALSVDEAAKVIAKDDLDILVDYDGIHDFNSLKVLIVQPARVQITWLGFAGTTGLSPTEGVQYMLADSVIAAPDVNGLFLSERVIYIPGAYQPQDELQALDLTPSDADIATSSPSTLISLSDLWFTPRSRYAARMDILRRYGSGMSTTRVMEVTGSVWFICFNRLEKITPGVFEDWMRILERTTASGAVLVLMAESEEAQIQLEKNALSFGVLGERRLVFLQRMPKRDYLMALAASDLFLDTYNYDAHTTASDAMYGSLPVLTRPGKTISSRVASSLNAAIGLSMMTVESRKIYVDTAVTLVEKKRDLLLHIRLHIRNSIGRDIFNSTRFSSKLEVVYRVTTELHPSNRHVFFMETLL